MNRKWTQEELEFLKENWGNLSVPTIGKQINRTAAAIQNKAFDIGLRRFTQYGEYITVYDLIKSIGQFGNYSELNKRFKKNGLKIKKRKVINKAVQVVYIDDFWDWCKRNQNKIDFSKFEENMLGEEEEWVKVKRNRDKLKRKKFKTTPWSESEDSRLINALREYKYSYGDLSKILSRTEGAIQRRISDLGLNERPVKAKIKKWTVDDYYRLANMIKARYSYEMISEELGRTVKSIRGRVYAIYGSENLDKVVETINLREN